MDKEDSGREAVFKYTLGNVRELPPNACEGAAGMLE